MKAFNVLIHDINSNKVKSYNIMPYLIKTYTECKKEGFWWMCDKTDHMPTTREEILQFINNICRYRYWARCEYEFLIIGWPPGRTETLEDCHKVINSSYKIDVYEQIQMNLDIIVDIFIENIKD